MAAHLQQPRMPSSQEIVDHVVRYHRIKGDLAPHDPAATKAWLEQRKMARALMEAEAKPK